MRANHPIKTKTLRQQLTVRKKPYNDSLGPRRLLGYIRRADAAGSWVVDVEIDRAASGRSIRRQHMLGLADDYAQANDADILSYPQAVALASAWQPKQHKGATSGAFTVRDAVEQHRDFGGRRGDKVARNKARAYSSLRWHALGEKSDGSPRLGAKSLGDVPVDKLTNEMLESWRAGVKGPAATKQRVWTNLRSCLKQAYRTKSNGITSDKAWKDVPSLSQQGARREVRYSNEEACAVIDAARAIDPAVADYFEALFRTGARPGGELFALAVGDFNPALRRLKIRGRDDDTTSKTGERFISLDKDAAALFTRLAAGRASTAPLLASDDEGISPWSVNAHQRRFKDVLLRAGAPADAVCYSFRHTFISRRLEQGMPTSMVAKHCGTSVAMIESNYAEFLPSETLRWLDATAPKPHPVLQLVKTDELPREQQAPLSVAA